MPAPPSGTGECRLDDPDSPDKLRYNNGRGGGMGEKPFEMGGAPAVPREHRSPPPSHVVPGSQSDGWENVPYDVRKGRWNQQ
ncbi:hypothetical protein PG999_008275 [Apiospora kogelbergensis]|uniref:Uncharacterized protein n=1 Tax=Apiospora kogelbergensis TaxID=1337665 RepID=A0AAW0QS13_9PEZI